MAEIEQAVDDIKTATTAADPDQQEQERVRKFLRLGVQRFKLAAEAENRTRTDMLDDLRFRAGEQWPDDIETQRGLDGRPCLTINRIPPIIRQVTNEQRQQRPSIVVNPIGGGADTDTAEMLQGAIRHIEVNSDAEIAYDTAFESAVTIGMGYWKLRTDYIPKSFDQEIFIDRVKNPFRIYFDPAAIEPCYEDAMWAFEIEDIPIDEYKFQYPDSRAAGLTDFQSIGDQFEDWATKDTIRVAMYWHVEQSFRTLCRLTDGSIKWKEEVDETTETIKDTRQCLERKVMQSKINAIEILEETEWPGMWIPIVPVLADDLDIDGKRYLAGIVRDSKDPQRMYNYWNSSATETIALAPRAPYIGAEGQFENLEGMWAQANTRNMPFVTYKPVSVNGTPIGAPQRQQFEPPIQSMNLMMRTASDDLKAVTGVYDPSLGLQKSDQSGRAVQLLQKQSDVSNMHFVDNLSRAMRHTGRLLIDLMPKIYDAPRLQRIINPDGSVDHVIFHNGQEQAAQGMGNTQNPALAKIYDLGVGTYDVSVSVGPSYQSKRQESVASIMALVSAYPQIMQFAGDILIRNMDWPGAKEIADRAQKLLPPAVQDNSDDSPEAQLILAKQQLAQLGQQHQLLVNALNEATDKIKTKQVEQQGQFQIAKLNAETKIACTEIQTQAQIAMERAKTVQGVWSDLHGSAHELAMQSEQHGHEADMQESAGEQAQELQAAKPQPETTN